MKKSVVIMTLSFISLVNMTFAADNGVPQSQLVSAKPNVPIANATDPTKTITVTNSSSEFTIELPSNPTTGYSWFIKSYDHALLKLTKQEYIPPTEQLVGAGGKSIWHFAALPVMLNGNYATQVELMYARPWELGKNPAAKIAVFNIVSMASHDVR